MVLTIVCRKLYVLNLGIFVMVGGFTSLARSESIEAKETKKVNQVVTALKRHNRCESVIVSSNNLSAVFWLHKGELEISQPFWSSESRNRLGKLIKNLKLNHK